MCKIEMNGTWRGCYEYGPAYSKALRGKQVEFFLNLKANNDEFFGECIDVSEDYRNNLTAEVKGFVRDGLISFVKKYPHHFITKADGSKEINYDKKHPEIEYTGYYDVDAGTFTGEWRMVTRTVVTKYDYSSVIPYSKKYSDKERHEMSVKEYFCSGTWEIEKQED